MQTHAARSWKTKPGPAAGEEAGEKAPKQAGKKTANNRVVGSPENRHK